MLLSIGRDLVWWREQTREDQVRYLAHWEVTQRARKKEIQNAKKKATRRSRRR